MQNVVLNLKNTFQWEGATSSSHLSKNGSHNTELDRDYYNTASLSLERDPLTLDMNNKHNYKDVTQSLTVQIPISG